MLEQAESPDGKKWKVEMKSPSASTLLILEETNLKLLQVPPSSEEVLEWWDAVSGPKDKQDQNRSLSKEREQGTFKVSDVVQIHSHQNQAYNGLFGTLQQVRYCKI